MRSVMGRRRRRAAATAATWAEALERAVIGHRVAAPAVPRGTELVVLRLWSRYRDEVAGRAAGRLAVMARDAGLDRAALDAVRHRRDDRRLPGIEVAGRLGLDELWDDLERFARSGRDPVWERAAVALVRMRPVDAVRLLVPLVGDALPARAAAWSRILAAGPAAPVATAVADLLPTLEGAGRDAITRGLAGIDATAALPEVRRQLRLTDEASFRAACIAVLAACGDDGDAVRVRAHLDHPAWEVRLEAAVALGRLGRAADTPALAALLDDEEWLVRRAASESLARVGDVRAVARLARRHPDATVRAALDLGLSAQRATEALAGEGEADDRLGVDELAPGDEARHVVEGHPLHLHVALLHGRGGDRVVGEVTGEEDERVLVAEPWRVVELGE